jgi:hypothetical protein
MTNEFTGVTLPLEYFKFGYTNYGELDKFMHEHTIRLNKLNAASLQSAFKILMNGHGQVQIFIGGFR